MNKLAFCTFVLVYFFGILQFKIIKGAKTSQTKSYKISHLDLIINDLLREEWASDEAQCLKRTMNILNNVKNSTLWATWVWDSMQLPAGVLFGAPYHLGNYDECINVPWAQSHPESSTQYCLLDIQLSREDLPVLIDDPYSSVADYIKSTTRHGLKFYNITWGVCVHSECQSKSVKKIAHSLLKNSHLNFEDIKIIINTDSCQKSGVTESYSKESKLIILLTVSIITIVTSTTIYNFVNKHKYDNYDNKFIKALCLTENLYNLGKTFKDEVTVFHGIRSINSVIVIIVHCWFVFVTLGVHNMMELENINEMSQPLQHVDLIVDTYFMMSGFLLMKNCMTGDKINPLKLIIKRYLRLTWPTVLVTLFICYVKIFNNPIFSKTYTQEKQFCEKTWLTGLLMMGNYIDATNICLPYLWSIPVDFHLSVVAIILYWIFQRRRKAGFVVFTILLIAALVMPGVVTYQKRLGASPDMDIRLIKDYRNVLYNNTTYIASHLRAGSYLIGIAAGFLMSVYKPDDHRKSISKNISLIGSILALVSAYKILLMANTINESTPFNALVAAVYASLNRSIWALMIMSLIVFCEYGTVPIIAKFLSWPGFVPLSKLSFGVYLVHVLVIFCISSQNTLRYSWLAMVFQVIGVSTLSFVISFLLHLFFEAPFHNIINILLKARSQKAINVQDKVISSITNGNGVKSHEKKML